MQSEAQAPEQATPFLQMRIGLAFQLEGKQAQMTFADLPYNLPIGGHVSGLGRVQHAEFPMASGDAPEDEFTAFLTIILERIRTHSAYGTIAYACINCAISMSYSWQAARRSSRSRFCACGSRATPAWAASLPLAARADRRLQGRLCPAHQ